ncbi:MAG TPA: ribonucleotide-diphosphate reductase subunit beta [Candidatus Paceibacterota bacterium]|nr:ribonucleotide-diphosphate reductase subunit beta [Candidatus Paceibacterota bacterium]
MPITLVKKRNGTVVDFDRSRIESAISRAYQASKVLIDIVSLSDLVDSIVLALEKSYDGEKIPEVEEIQNFVEKAIADKGDFEVAKAYILYREERNKERRRDIFKKRVNLKPYEYPELYEYVSAIRHSYWIHTEFNFVGDVQNFKVNVDEKERNVIKNAMLAIAQIEVAVKTFWGDIYKKMPKPEIGAVGSTFAESEVRHTDAYSHLLEILGLNEVFSNIQDIPVLMKRVNYLEKALSKGRSEDNKEYSQSVLLFSLFIEHVSLFSQFLIIMSFNKHKNLFKGISNAVEATSKEEQIHGLFGIDVINIIKQEHPEWFDQIFEEEVIGLCEEAFESEKQVVEWIFEKGELGFMKKDVVIEFIKQRFNNSLQSIGVRKIFDTDENLLKESDWFYDEVIATKHGDFFNKKSINYNKKSKSITSDDLF